MAYNKKLFQIYLKNVNDVKPFKDNRADTPKILLLTMITSVVVMSFWYIVLEIAMKLRIK
jgi:hypothetical protein